jgi:hypothetical protein
VEQGLTVEETAESRNLPGDGASNFGFGIFEEFDECWDEVSADNLLIDSFGNLNIYQHMLQ